MVVVLWMGYCINGRDDVGSLMMWDDGFCRGRMMDCVEDIDAGKILLEKPLARCQFSCIIMEKGAYLVGVYF
ncbi:hypothetical protein HanPI659440_Chr05g0210881 [Helianthus annuus]|nr:hypothetical protein HanPI659440_Chr05g0210881 [Helianthus annuus]